MSSVLKENLLVEQFNEDGYSTLHFPEELRKSMLTHIEEHIRELGLQYSKQDQRSIEQIAMQIPDEVWAKKMARAFRMFPKDLASSIHNWADENIRKKFGKSRSAINVVGLDEVALNSKISKDSLAIYWRCVRPGKPDAGRPHRDATFWIVEFEKGYDPRIPFPFDYIKDSIKIWIPLKGCTPQTTLQIIPKSHRMDLPTIIEETEYGRRPNIAYSWLQDHECDFMSPSELSQGSSIIFDMDLVHRGPVHNNSELRISAELTLIVH